MSETLYVRNDASGRLKIEVEHRHVHTHEGGPEKVAELEMRLKGAQESNNDIRAAKAIIERELQDAVTAITRIAVEPDLDPRQFAQETLRKLRAIPRDPGQPEGRG